MFTGTNSLCDSLNLTGKKQIIYSIGNRTDTQWWDMKWNICNLFVLNHWWLSNFIISNIKLELRVQNPDLLSQHDWGRVFLDLFYCMLKKMFSHYAGDLVTYLCPTSPKNKGNWKQWALQMAQQKHLLMPVDIWQRFCICQIPCVSQIQKGCKMDLND